MTGRIDLGADFDQSGVIARPDVGLGNTQTFGTASVNELALGLKGATATADFSQASLVSLTLTSATSCTLTFVAPAYANCTVYLRVQQATSGTATTIVVPGTVAPGMFVVLPQPSTVLSSYTMYTLFWDGTSYWLINASSASTGGASPLTTKGDIFTHSSSADARLPVGTDRQQLIASSAATNGIAYEWPGFYPIAQAVCTGSQATVPFNNIPQIFQTLLLVFQARDTNTSSGEIIVNIAFNGDTTSGNYSNAAFLGNVNNGVNCGSVAPSSQGLCIGVAPGTLNNANAVGQAQIHIANYSNTTFYKTVNSEYMNYFGNGSTSLDTGRISGVWKSSAAITDMLISAGGTAFLDNSVFYLYGIGLKGTNATTLTLTGSYWSPAQNSVPYTSSLSINGGNGVYSNPRVVGGALPAGLALSIVGSTLLLSGTPTSGAGSFAFIVAVDSGDGQTATSVLQVVAIVVSSLANEIIADAPYAWYPMQEASGTTMLDASGNARHGTIYTNANKTIGNAPIALNDSRSYRMSVQDTCIGQTPVLNLISVATDPWTVEGIVRTTTLSDSGALNYIMVLNPNNGNGPSVHYRNIGNQKLRGAFSSSTLVSEETNASRGSTIHYMFVCGNGSPSNRDLYINGKFVGTTNDAHSNPSDYYVFGGDRPGGSSTLGLLAYFSHQVFYATDLSAARALAHARAAGLVTNYDPTAKSGNINTSDNAYNAKAVMAATAAVGAVLSRNGFTAGASTKRIFEITNGGGDATHAWRWGLATSDQGLTSHIGASATASLGINAVAATQTQANTGSKFTDAAFTSSTPAGIGTTGKVQVAIDFAAKKVWISTAAGTAWIGGGNPDSGTTPTFTFIGTDTYYVGSSMDGTNGSTSATFNGAGSFVLNPGNATSFTAWDV